MYTAIIGASIGAGVTTSFFYADSEDLSNVALGTLMGGVGGLIQTCAVRFLQEKEEVRSEGSHKNCSLKRIEEIFHCFGEKYLSCETQTSLARFQAIIGIVTGVILTTYGLFSLDLDPKNAFKNSLYWTCASTGSLVTATFLIRFLNREEPVDQGLRKELASQGFSRLAFISITVAGMLAITAEVGLLRNARDTIGWQLGGRQYGTMTCTTMAVWILALGFTSFFDLIDKREPDRTPFIIEGFNMISMLWAPSLLIDYTKYQLGNDVNTRLIKILASCAIINYLMCAFRRGGLYPSVNSYSSANLIGRMEILGAAAGAAATWVFHLKFPGSIVVIGYLAGGLIASAVKASSFVGEDPEVKKKYREGVAVLLGSAFALTSFEQANDLGIINSLAGSVLMLIGGLAGRLFLSASRDLRKLFFGKYRILPLLP